MFGYSREISSHSEIVGNNGYGQNPKLKK